MVAAAREMLRVGAGVQELGEIACAVCGDAWGGEPVTDLLNVKTDADWMAVVDFVRS